MDPAISQHSSPSQGVYGSKLPADADVERRRSSENAAYARWPSQGRRKSSVTYRALEKAMGDPVTVVEGADLSDADRRLAEMGYIQVCAGQATLFGAC